MFFHSSPFITDFFSRIELHLTYDIFIEKKIDSKSIEECDFKISWSERA